MSKYTKRGLRARMVEAQQEIAEVVKVVRLLEFQFMSDWEAQEHILEVIKPLYPHLEVSARRCWSYGSNNEFAIKIVDPRCGAWRSLRTPDYYL